MPAYKKKITRQMSYQEFKDSIGDETPQRTAFLYVLYFSACRISEALALDRKDISCTQDTIYIDFFRLKGSKQTDPIPIPRIPATEYLCDSFGKLFDFSRTTGYRIVKKWFPELYPHYWRATRISKISEKYGDAHVYSFVGICAQSIDHYRQKVDIKRIGQALKEEVKG